MNDMTIASQHRFEETRYPIPPYLGFEQQTNVSYGTSAALDKLGAMFAIVMALGPLAMAAYGANFGVSAMG